MQESSGTCYNMHLQVWEHIDGIGVLQIWYIFCALLLNWFLLYNKATVLFDLRLNEIEFIPISACNVKWLGLRDDDLHLIPENAFMELKPRDHQISKSLLSSNFLPV